MRSVSKSRTIFCALLVWAALWMQGSQGVIDAQSTWLPATILWEAQAGTGPYVNNATNLVTDPAGWVHAVWLNFPKGTGGGGQEAAIYYSRWDGQGWAAPVDIFAATAGEPLGNPVLLPTADGCLHILWISNSRLKHSWAWADDAARPQAWSLPEIAAYFSGAAVALFDAAVDAQGSFHTVFTERQGELYHIRSDDQGETWSEPAQIYQVGPDLAPYLPQVAVASDGRIHVVWSEVPAVDYGQTMGGVYHAFSADGGSTWTEPREFAGRGHSDANVAAFEGNKVYVTWQAGTSTSGGRYLRYSDDAGLTWSDSLEFSKRAGLSNYPSINQDSLGRLHLLTGDGEYVMWDGATFTPPVLLAPTLIQTERCRMTIANGQTLVAVLPPDDGIVYSIVRVLDVPPIAAQPRPTRGPRETTQPTVTLALTAAPTADLATPTLGPAAPTGMPPPSLPTSAVPPLLVGAASALAVILLALIIWTLLKRRN